MIAGANVTVNGTGQALDPYIISANDATFTTLDTATVTLVLTPGSPDVLMAAVNLDPIAGNLITTTAQGLRVDCTGVIGCFTAGVAIDSAALALGAISVCLSSDIGNTLTVGTDGCLFVPTSGGGTPFVIDPDPDNLLGPSTTSLLATIAPGCGLTGAGTVASPLKVDTQTVWPWACAETAGANIYCDTATGRVLTEPEKFFLWDKLDQPVINSTANFNSLAPLGGSSAVGLGTSAIITNPSNCRAMILKVTAGIQHAFITQPPGSGNGRMECQLDSGLVVSAPATLISPAVQNGHQHWAHSDDTNAERATFDTTGSFGVSFYLLPAGAATTVTMSAAFSNIQNSGPIQAQVTSWKNTAIIEGWSV